MLRLEIVTLSLCMPAAGASLSGIVVENRTGRPLARTQVNVEPISGTSTDGVMHSITDSAGHFLFPNLTAGSFHVIARRKDFVQGRYGQRGWDLPATPVVLGENDNHAIEIRLQRPGSISGEIYDENRIGLSECPVYAFRLDKRIRVVASGETDDRGRYRIAGLQPGQYLIGTSARVLPGNRSLLPTFFGQTASATAARSVDVKLEEETTDVSIEPLAGQLGALRVIAPGATSVSLLTDFGRAEGQPSPAGVYQFGGLAPGTYELLAEGASGNIPVAAWERVAIGGETRSVTLQLGPAPVLRVACRDRHDQPLPPQLVSVFLRRRDTIDDPPLRVNCGDAATLTPGDWTFTPVTPSNFYLAEVADVRAGDGAYEFTVSPRQQRELMLVLSSRPAVLFGKVTAPDGAPAIGAPVFLRALEADAAARVGGSRYSQADRNGEYRFDGLGPGNYEVISSFQLRQGDLAAWRNGQGLTVELVERQEKILDLNLTSLSR